jgi:hypothetical protein
MNTKPQRPAFLPLSSDVDDARLEQLARDKGVGTFERPVREKRAEPPQQASQIAAPKRAEPVSGEVSPTPRARMKTLNLELPDYVWTELKIRAAQRQTSLRHVVMAALVGDGVSIADVDMIEDGRRLRGGSAAISS